MTDSYRATIKHDEHRTYITLKVDWFQDEIRVSVERSLTGDERDKAIAEAVAEALRRPA